MDKEMEKKITLIETFLESAEIDGVCSFWIEKSPKFVSNFCVYLLINENWHKETSKITWLVEKQIHGYIGIWVSVNYILGKCD